MFDLEKAIASWRRSFRYRRVFFEDDLEELERHVRDHVVWLVERGFSEKEAFQKAMHSVGGYSVMEAEYRKVFWAKVRHKQALFNEIIGEITMLKSYLKSAVRQFRLDGHTPAQEEFRMKAAQHHIRIGYCRLCSAQAIASRARICPGAPGAHMKKSSLIHPSNAPAPRSD